MKNFFLKILEKHRSEGPMGAVFGAWRKLSRRGGYVPNPVHTALKAIEREDFVIVQLGAFTGDTENDPLYGMVVDKLKNSGGKLILVEPVKSAFEKLVSNYEGVPGVEFENVAISDKRGPAKFFRLGVDPEEHGYPAWLAQLGSLKDERMKSLWDQYESEPAFQSFYLENRVEETVDCITFEDLVNRHKLERIDLLQVDVEGYEFEIISSIDFKQTPCRFINYEFVLLQERKEPMETLLVDEGYHFFHSHQDTFCYRPRDGRRFRVW